MDFDVADDAILFVEAADEADLDDADPLATRAGNTPVVAAVAVEREDAAPVAFTGADPADDSAFFDDADPVALTAAFALAVAKDREMAIDDADARKDDDPVALLIDGDEAEAETLALAPAVTVERDDAAPEAVRPDEAGVATVFVDCWPIAN